MTATAMSTMARPRTGSLGADEAEADEAEADEAEADAAAAGAAEEAGEAEFSGFTLVTQETLVANCGSAAHCHARRA